MIHITVLIMICGMIGITEKFRNKNLCFFMFDSGPFVAQANRRYRGAGLVAKFFEAMRESLYEYEVEKFCSPAENIKKTSASRG